MSAMTIALFAVRTMITGISATHHRILFRRSFHVRARQVVEQHVELRSEQLAVTLFEMALQFGLMRQDPVRTTVQARVRAEIMKLLAEKPASVIKPLKNSVKKK